MSLKITHNYSTAAGTPPASGDIDVGEIAINAADAELYVKDDAGNIRKFQNTTTGTANGVQFTQAGTGAVQRTVESKLQDVVSVKDFGAVGDGVADDTAAIQAAIDAVATRGSLVANKSGIGGLVFIPAGTYKISAPLQIKTHGIVIGGEGPSSSALLLADETVDLLVFSSDTAFTGGISGRLAGVGVRDLRLHINNSSITDARTCVAITFDRCGGSSFVTNCWIENFNRGLLLKACEKGNQYSNLQITSGSGSATGEIPDSAAIVLTTRQVDATDPLGTLDPLDGLYYAQNTSQYFSDIQTSNTGWGYKDVFVVNGIDGLYVSNSHLGFGTQSIIHAYGLHSNQPILNTHIVGVFADDSSTLGGGTEQTAYGILINDPLGKATNITDFTVAGGEVNGCKAAGVYLNTAGLQRFQMTGMRITGAQNHSIQVVAGTDLMFNGCIIQNNSAATGSYVVVQGGTRVSFSDISCSGGASKGFNIQAGTDLSFDNCRVYNATADSFVVGGTLNNPRFVNCLSDRSGTVASAGTLVLVPEFTSFFVTGTTNILTIDSGGPGNGSWPGREITLIFEDVLTVTKAGGNMGLRSNFVTAAGSALTLVYVNGAWREKSRIA